MLLQTHKTFVHLQNTNEDVFDEIWELSDPPLTATQLKCSQVQKRSKYIGKTVHVTSVAQLQFYDFTRILFFLHKENKNNNLLNHSSPPSYLIHRFREYHNTYTRFRLSVNNADYVKSVLRNSQKWPKMLLGGEEWRVR